ncbi:cytochrome c family protein [Kordiimonas sediminis]|uniref:Cytochrome c family protein n=1 Tax=Kordiimonas sediminis TaxID=1735581 RepID=A0A919AMB8_9PROT|nr:cytochrome c family protein [Kordiimonas sediminis]GHF12755.1 cytochrome c family protein [Kordiimonas sediminis]
MDSFEWNKVFGAVIASALVIMVISTVSGMVYPENHPEKPAYTIEVASAEGAEEAVEEQGPTLAELMVGASADKGERQFAKCKACHTVEKGGRQGTGPNLYGLIGRAVASVDGFKYSSAVADHGGEWTYELLDHWLENPKTAIPGNSMSFAGIRKPDQRADLIAYLRSFADSPAPLPTVEAVEEAVEEATEEVAETVEGAVEGQ